MRKGEGGKKGLSIPFSKRKFQLYFVSCLRGEYNGEGKGEHHPHRNKESGRASPFKFKAGKKEGGEDVHLHLITVAKKVGSFSLEWKENDKGKGEVIDQKEKNPSQAFRCRHRRKKEGGGRSYVFLNSGRGRKKPPSTLRHPGRNKGISFIGRSRFLPRSARMQRRKGKESTTLWPRRMRQGETDLHLLRNNQHQKKKRKGRRG